MVEPKVSMFFNHLQPCVRLAPKRSYHAATVSVAIMSLSLALLLDIASARAQSSSDDFHETLLNAERAIMEGLSAQALGAAPQTVPVKAAMAPLAPPRVSADAPITKKAPKPVPETKKAHPPKVTEKAPAAPQPPSEAEVRATILTRQNDALKKEIQGLHAQVTQLKSELQSTRNELTVAETEANRLSTVVDAKTRASLGRYNVPMPPTARPPAQAPQILPAAQPAVKPAEDVKPPSRSTDMQIATVTVDKADLRAGPGKNNSAIMSLRRGSRLAVEDRQGEWYRVFAPNGERAWVHASLVSFGDGASSMNDGSAVRVKGFSPNAEEEAFRRLQKISASK